MSGTEFDHKTGTIIKNLGRVYPTQGRVRTEVPEVPVYVACGRIREGDSYKVLGWTKDLGLATFRIEAREEKEHRWQRFKLKTIYTELLNDTKNPKLAGELRQLLSELDRVEKARPQKQAGPEHRAEQGRAREQSHEHKPGHSP